MAVRQNQTVNARSRVRQQFISAWPTLLMKNRYLDYCFLDYMLPSASEHVQQRAVLCREASQGQTLP